MTVVIRRFAVSPWNDIPRTGRLDVVAKIDSEDELHLLGDGLYWRHTGGYARVGMHRGVHPTILNGVCWWPHWPPRSSTCTPLATDAFAPNGRALQIDSYEGTRNTCHVATETGTETVLVFANRGNNSGTGQLVAHFVSPGEASAGASGEGTR